MEKIDKMAKIEKEEWFRKCPRVPWQPPDFIFRFVWPILYTLYAITLYQHWNQPALRNILLLGLALNFAWVPSFVANTKLALVVIVGMIAVAIESLRLLYLDDMLHKSKWPLKSSTLFAPYLAWILFAFTLNVYLASKC